MEVGGGREEGRKNEGCCVGNWEGKGGQSADAGDNGNVSSYEL